jgi:hypothetical protein
VEKATRLVRPLSVTGGGEGLVSHAGLVWLGRVADATGLAGGFHTAMRALPRRRHDPGRTLLQVVLTLADGGSCVSDLAGLAGSAGLFGPVASVPTAWRSFNRVGPAELRGLDRAVAAAREVAWRARYRGRSRGGHEVEAYGLDVERRVVHLYNSWGPIWGLRGTCACLFRPGVTPPRRPRRSAASARCVRSASTMRSRSAKRRACGVRCPSESGGWRSSAAAGWRA